MGAWGPGAFENDEALDWLADTADLGADGVIGSLEAVIQPPVAGLPEPEVADLIEMAISVLAAAETVAHMLGRSTPQIKGPLKAQVEVVGEGLREKQGVADLALRAMDAVLAPGAPLAALWHQEGMSGAQWDAEVAGLRARLTDARGDYPEPWAFIGEEGPIGTFVPAAKVPELGYEIDGIETPIDLISYAVTRADQLQMRLGLPDGLPEDVDYGDDGLEGLPAFLQQYQVNFERLETMLGLGPTPRDSIDTSAPSTQRLQEIAGTMRDRLVRLDTAITKREEARS